MLRVTLSEFLVNTCGGKTGMARLSNGENLTIRLAVSTPSMSVSDKRNEQNATLSATIAASATVSRAMR